MRRCPEIVGFITGPECALWGQFDEFLLDSLFLLLNLCHLLVAVYHHIDFIEVVIIEAQISLQFYSFLCIFALSF